MFSIADDDNIDFPPTFIGMTESKQIHVINNSDEVSFFEWICSEPIRSEKKVDRVQGVERYLEVYPKAICNSSIMSINLLNLSSIRVANCNQTPSPK